VVEVRAEYGEECRRPGQYYPCVDIRSGGLGLGGLGPEQEAVDSRYIEIYTLESTSHRIFV
jgi:hypothetical protein